jgi:RNA polymerase sigma-70 factor (ECF subfamily)
MQADKQTTEAFVSLLREHERLIYKVCSLYSKDAEDRSDLYQEIVLQLWRAYPGFKGLAKTSTWLYRVALNTAISINRKKRVKASFEESILLNFPDPFSAEQDDKYRQMYYAISCLSELERAVILLYLEDRSHQDIAEIIGMSVSNVGTRIGRIKEKMKTIVASQK